MGIPSALLGGIPAGLAGTGVITLLSRLRGQTPVYDPDRMAGRLSARFLHRPLSAEDRRRYGSAMRWSYGLGWGVLLAGLQRWLKAPSLLTGAALGGAIWLFELAALPAVGATPPLRKWGTTQIGGDAMQAVLFGIAAGGVLVVLDSPRKA